MTNHAGLEGLHLAASHCTDLQRVVPLDRWDVDAWCASLTPQTHDATNEHGQHLVTIKPCSSHDLTVKVPWQQSDDGFRGVETSVMV